MRQPVSLMMVPDGIIVAAWCSSEARQQPARGQPVARFKGSLARMPSDLSRYPAYQSSRPYVRWWWLDGPFRERDIASQLDWISEAGFGGVEIAWLDPTGQARPADKRRPEWLSAEWSGLVGFAKRHADSLGLGCDLTFGSSRPFGGSRVTAEDAAQTLDGPSSQQLLGSWEPGPRPVLNHLSEGALRRYAEALA